jgi:ribulose bisphosphate carboxylase small subunit
MRSRREDLIRDDLLDHPDHWMLVIRTGSKQSATQMKSSVNLGYMFGPNIVAKIEPNEGQWEVWAKYDRSTDSTDTQNV